MVRELKYNVIYSIQYIHDLGIATSVTWDQYSNKVMTLVTWVDSEHLRDYLD